MSAPRPAVDPTAPESAAIDLSAPDLSDYTLAEIRGLLFEIGAEIRKREREQRAAARERALAIAREAGLDPADLLGAPASKAPRKRRP